MWINRCSRPEEFLVKAVLKIFSKFTGEHPYRSAISITLLWHFIEITLRHGSSPNLPRIFRTPFSKSTTGYLLLNKWVLPLAVPSLVLNFKSRKSRQILIAIDLQYKTNLKNKQAKHLSFKKYIKLSFY